MIVPLFVGREKSIRALEEVMRDDKQILLVAQKNAGQDDPGTDDIYRVGTVSSVLQLLKLPDGTVKVLVEGNARAEINSFSDNPRFFQAHASLLPELDSDPRELEALARAVVSQFEQYVKLNKKVPPEVLVSLSQIDDPASSPIRSRRTCRSRSRTSRNCWRPARWSTGSSVSTPSWRARSACSRWRSASAPASSARWRRRSGSTTSTSR